MDPVPMVLASAAYVSFNTSSTTIATFNLGSLYLNSLMIFVTLYFTLFGIFLFESIYFPFNICLKNYCFFY